MTNNKQLLSIWRGVAIFLAAALLLGIILGVVFWQRGNIVFKSIGEEQAEELPKDEGGAVIGESVGSGMKLMSTRILSSEFEGYGISPMAETAYQVTATIEPNTASDQAVDWSVAFVNPSSSWASGKTVTDYVTVTPTSDGALTANVECLQAFGEKIIITVVSRDNPLISASCVVDYAQKITDIDLSFGNISVNLDGITYMQWQVNASGEGVGGTTDFEYLTTETYTLEDEFSCSVLVEDNHYESSSDCLNFGGHIWDTLGFSSPIDVTSSEFILDRDFLTSVNFVYDSRNGYVYLNELSASEFISALNPISNGRFAKVTVTVTGEYSSLTKTSDIFISEFVNTATVTNVSLNKEHLVF